MTVVEDDRLSILLVEDDELDEALIVSVATREGLLFDHFRVEQAEAFQTKLLNGRWDVIISDYNLPAFSANEVLEILRQSGLDIPCIVVSGHIGEEKAVSLMKAGACDFVPKGNLSRLAPAIRREAAEARNHREKRKVEQSLRHQEQLIAGIASALGEGLVVINAACEVIFVNPEAQRLLGWDEVALLGQKLHQTVHYLKADGSPYPEEECPIVHCAKQGISCSSEDDVFVRKDRSIFHVSYTATPIVEEDSIAAVVVVFQDITSRKQAEQALIESRSQLRELSNFLQTVREEERTRIAREMHDELGQSLTALKMDVAWMMSRLDDEQDELLSKADGMMNMIDATVDSVRRIAANLRPGLLDDLGLAAAIEWLLEEFERRTGVRHELRMSHDEFDFEPGLTTTVFRILQETITNVARHAKASRLFVRLEDQGEAVYLWVRDDGLGFDPQVVGVKRKSFGLLGIRERVGSLGGKIEITSQPGHGAELSVHLPKAVNHYIGCEA